MSSLGPGPRVNIRILEQELQGDPGGLHHSRWSSWMVRTLGKGGKRGVANGVRGEGTGVSWWRKSGRRSLRGQSGCYVLIEYLKGL